MHDEYSPRDLKYGKVKKYFEKEIRGVSIE